MTSPPSALPPPSEPWQPQPRPAAAPSYTGWTIVFVILAAIMALLGLFVLACIIGAVVVANSLGGSNK